MDILASPGRTLAAIVAYLCAVVVVATSAYMAAGWSLGDSFYMVLITVYSVGYNEVHPAETTYLRAVTLGTMIFGCTGTILFTGSLVQVLTASQLNRVFGRQRMERDVARLKGHVIVVGLGRTGMMLARELKAGGAGFVAVEVDPKKAETAEALGFLCVIGDGTDEDVLKEAGIGRARALATVLPNDAANVFITLSARSLNPEVTIVARGEMPATEGKLRQAGADHVVLPAHIGAERVAEVILYPELTRHPRRIDVQHARERVLRNMGLETEVVVAPEGGSMTGRSVAEIEARGAGRFMVVQVMRQAGEVVTRPEPDFVVAAGDGVMIVGRGVAGLRCLFDAPEATESPPAA
ncbi:potassium channel family protein [Sagittula salina]|uniref:NAD-binding protein n=1 Tax=Sagittula salina TaxID=2820268 RepID=A0A940ML83_9RHOB|nr:potassium channel protein [Sagittula salina]MBP0483865.1 NAD-binding protein [Sagittula salina]